MEFIKHYKLKSATEIAKDIDIDFNNGYIHDIVMNAYIGAVDSFNRSVEAAIINMAKDVGLTDVVLLDKTNILRALKNYAPAKPIRVNFDMCSSCGTPVRDLDKFCRECGQRIDWGREEN